MKVFNCLRWKAFYKLIVALGVISGFASILLGWGGLDFIFHLIIRKMSRLIPGNSLWENWKTIPFPVYIKFHLFNVSNPDEISTGGKPQLTDLGPYVYLVDFDKFDFEMNAQNDSISYSPSRTYIFQPKLSSGKEDDVVTYINVMFLAVSHIANDATDLDFILQMVDENLLSKGEGLTRRDTVRDLLFDGVSIQNYVDLVNDPLIAAGGGMQLPENYRDGRFALFKGKNGTKDGRWEVHSGIRESAELAELVSYHGKTSLEIYDGVACNAINGTDGTLNPPFGVTPLYIFIPELCRSIQWEFIRNNESKGIPVSRYRFPDSQPNCFCPNKASHQCRLKGIANLSPCFESIPLIYSKPHFLGANASVREMIEGMKPDPSLHESELDLHSLTGASVSASIRLQFSMELKPWESMPSFSKVSNAYVPFIWLELVANLSGFNLWVIRILSTFLKLNTILRWLAIAGSCLLIFTGMFFGVRSLKHNSISVISKMGTKKHETWLKKITGTG